MDSQLEHLQLKQVGTGHPDLTPHKFMVNQHRDTINTYLARHDMLSYFATAQGESVARIKFDLKKKLVQPCGPEPIQKSLDEGDM